MNNKLMAENRCYACGFELRDYPYDPVHLTPNHEVICSSCGIHYGYDDDGGGDIIPDELTYSDWKFGDENHVKIMKSWRQHWIDGGMKWWSTESKPKNWNPKMQLGRIPEGFK